MPHDAIVTAFAIDPSRPYSFHRTSIPLAAPGQHEVEIAVIRVGICGTDRELVAGEIGAAPAGEHELVLGHEMLGRISALGPAVDGFAVGDLVTATVRRPDGCPACAAGEPDMCLWLDYTERGIVGAHGFMTERIIEHVDWLVPVPEQLEAVGVLTEPLTVVEKAVRQAQLIQERLAFWDLRTAVVMGAGPIGILGTLLLRSMGVEVVTVARTPAPNRAAAIVEACGARYVATRETPIAELASSLPGIDLIIESTGSSDIVFQSMNLLGNNGVLVLLSLIGGNATTAVSADALSTSLVVGNKVVVGSINAGSVDFVNAVARFDEFERHWPGLTESMITHRAAIGDDPATIIGRRDAGIKTVVEFSAS